ncbi:MAG: hypothetical protein N3G18_02840 [Candidatus Saccharicenans sp.]|nr:hypothetical protein [Candidatus Saccharicenans sp.]
MKPKKNSARLLALFNAILLCVSWLMMIRAYPRLPAQIPYWLPLAGQDVLRAPKGPLFFLYPLFQTLFLAAFYLAGLAWVKKPERGDHQETLMNKKELTGVLPENKGEVAGKKGASDSGAAGSVPENLQAIEGSAEGRRALISGRGEALTPPAEISPVYRAALINLKKELVWLWMIFFNLVFIHIQRSLIWLAHGLSFGVNKVYFFTLIIILLLLIPYYRFRLSLLNRGPR